MLKFGDGTGAGGGGLAVTLGEICGAALGIGGGD